MSGPSGEHPCDSTIFLIHPCCYEVLPAEQVRADNLSLFVRSEQEVKDAGLRICGTAGDRPCSCSSAGLRI